MATPVTQLERSAVRERVLDVIRGLLDELGSQGALPMLNPASQLDRDLGLGSLERVELLARLETAFHIRLPDRVASEANTPEDLARAILSAPGTNAEDGEAGSALRASGAALPFFFSSEAISLKRFLSTICAILNFESPRLVIKTELRSMSFSKATFCLSISSFSSMSESPDAVMLTLPSICRTMISICLSEIFTPCIL